MIAPVTRGAGVNNKVLEPLAAGRQLVTTSVGTRGLPPSVVANLRHATDGSRFASELCSMLDTSWGLDPARAARSSVRALSWDRAGALMERVLDEVARPGTTTSEQQAG